MNIEYYLKLGNLYVESMEITNYSTDIDFTSYKDSALVFASDEAEIKKSIIELLLNTKIEKEMK